MKTGNLVLVFIMLCVVAGGMWMRSVAIQQWQLTQQFYRGHAPYLAKLDALHRRVRGLWVAGGDAAKVHAEATALASELHRIIPPNGRTIRTQEAEEAYLGAASLWSEGLMHGQRAPASPSFLDLEVDWGDLVGQVRMQDHTYAFRMLPAPGTMPTPTPHRVI